MLISRLTSTQEYEDFDCCGDVHSADWISRSPEVVTFEVLPVLPPNLRPLLASAGGRMAVSDINELYRRSFNINNRIRRLIQLKADRLIIENEKARRQESIDAIFCNKRLNNKTIGLNYSALHNLEDLLQKNAGEEDLLDGLCTSRLDDSAYTKLVFGSTDGVDTANIPKQLAWDLFRPLIIKELLEDREENTFRMASRAIDRRDAVAEKKLLKVMEDAVVVLHFKAMDIPLIGFKVGLTNGLAAEVHVELAEYLGSEALGKPISIFSIFSSDAIEQVKNLLLPSVVMKRPSELVPVPTGSPWAVGKANLAATFATRALRQVGFPLSKMDMLLLGPVCSEYDQLIARN